MLKVRNLSIIDSSQTTLTNISLTAGRGEITAVIGDDESGVSRLLTAIVNPDVNYQGEVIVSHYKAKAEPNRVRQMIGSLLQPFEPPLHLTGFEYLELIGSFYNVGPDERVARIIQLGNLFSASRILYTVMERLSPAAKQKIGLMGSILSSPPVLIWEEPLLHLDPLGQQTARVLLKELTTNGTSVLIASNHLDFVAEVADNIIVLSGGEIVTQGSLAELSRISQKEKNGSALLHHVRRHRHD